MVVVLIGVIALIASVSSWFPPGIALGIGLIAFGALLSLTDRIHEPRDHMGCRCTMTALVDAGLIQEAKSRHKADPERNGA